MLKLNGCTINFGTFPNGESYADIEERTNVYNGKKNVIFMKFENDADILHLQFLKDFVDEYAPNEECVLNMAYIPYSRMDRKENSRLFTLKSFSRIINSLNFSEVVVMEPHSEVSVALIDRVRVVNKSAELALIAMRDTLGLVGGAWFNKYSYEDIDENSMYSLGALLARAEKAGIYLVYPDSGAEKRYTKQIVYPKVMTCSKERDFNTGNIKSIVLNGYEKAQDCTTAIIVDDLCSKGGTFVGSAVELYKHLPNLKKVILCVTHCENTIFDGSLLTEKGIGEVYTTKSILTKDHPKLKICDD